MPQNAPESRGQKPPHYQDFLHYTGKLEGQPTPIEKNLDAEVGRRMEGIAKKVDGMHSAVEKAKEARVPPGEEALDATVRGAMTRLEEMASGLKGVLAGPEARLAVQDALAHALALLKAQPSIVSAPTKELVDSLVTIGKAAKNSFDQTDPFFPHAELNELRTIVIDMQAKLAARPAAGATQVQNIIINNNLAPQGVPQSQVRVVEKKEEQKGWKEKGADLVYQANEGARTSQALGLIYESLKAGRPVPQELYPYIAGSNFSQMSPSEQKKYIADKASKNGKQWKLTLKEVNSLVENAMNVSEDRNVIAATREEVNNAMDEWLRGKEPLNMMITRMETAYKIPV